MRKLQIAMAVLTCLVLAKTGLAQSSNASVGGLVQDASQTNKGFFMIFVIASLSAALLMLLFVPLLKKLTASVKA